MPLGGFIRPLRTVGVQAVINHHGTSEVFWQIPPQWRKLGSSPFQRASLLASRATHSGDWLLALPITACGLRLDDEAVRIAVALRLGSELGSPHSCRCGSSVDARGTHDFVCKHAPSRVVRHHALNEWQYNTCNTGMAQRAFR